MRLSAAILDPLLDALRKHLPFPIHSRLLVRALETENPSGLIEYSLEMSRAGCATLPAPWNTLLRWPIALAFGERFSRAVPGALFFRVPFPPCPIVLESHSLLTPNWSLLLHERHQMLLTLLREPNWYGQGIRTWQQATPPDVANWFNPISLPFWLMRAAPWHHPLLQFLGDDLRETHISYAPITRGVWPGPVTTWLDWVREHRWLFPRMFPDPNLLRWPDYALPIKDLTPVRFKPAAKGDTDHDGQLQLGATAWRDIYRFHSTYAQQATTDFLPYPFDSYKETTTILLLPWHTGSRLAVDLTQKATHVAYCQRVARALEHAAAEPTSTQPPDRRYKEAARLYAVQARNLRDPFAIPDYWLPDRVRENTVTTPVAEPALPVLDSNALPDGLRLSIEKTRLHTLVTPLVTVGFYQGEVRQLARDLKEKKADANQKAGALLAQQLQQRHTGEVVLIPIPHSDGTVTGNLKLCHAIQVAYPQATILPILTGPKRESQYTAKMDKHVALTPAQITITTTQPVPSSLWINRKSIPVYLVDNVLDTGATLLAAQHALGGIPGALVLAVTEQIRYEMPKSYSPLYLPTASLADLSAASGGQYKEAHEIRLPDPTAWDWRTNLWRPNLATYQLHWQDIKCDFVLAPLYELTELPHPLIGWYCQLRAVREVGGRHEEVHVGLPWPKGYKADATIDAVIQRWNKALTQFDWAAVREASIFAFSTRMLMLGCTPTTKGLTQPPVKEIIFVGAIHGVAFSRAWLQEAPKAAVALMGGCSQARGTATRACIAWRPANHSKWLWWEGSAKDVPTGTLTEALKQNFTLEALPDQLSGLVLAGQDIPDGFDATGYQLEILPREQQVNGHYTLYKATPIDQVSQQGDAPLWNPDLAAKQLKEGSEVYCIGEKEDAIRLPLHTYHVTQPEFMTCLRVPARRLKRAGDTIRSPLVEGVTFDPRPISLSHYEQQILLQLESWHQLQYMQQCGIFISDTATRVGLFTGSRLILSGSTTLPAQHTLAPNIGQIVQPVMLHGEWDKGVIWLSEKGFSTTGETNFALTLNADKAQRYGATDYFDLSLKQIQKTPTFALKINLDDPLIQFLLSKKAKKKERAFVHCSSAQSTSGAQSTWKVQDQTYTYPAISDGTLKNRVFMVDHAFLIRALAWVIQTTPSTAPIRIMFHAETKADQCIVGRSGSVALGQMINAEEPFAIGMLNQQEVDTEETG